MTEQGQGGEGELTIGLLSPGDMGHTVGRVLLEAGIATITCLAGRSERTVALARSAGIEAVDDEDELVRRADLILSILVPDQAAATASRIREAVVRTGADVLYVDANAISPATTRAMAEELSTAGIDYVDAGIVGPPPTRPGVTRFYASGPAAARFAQAVSPALDVRVIGAEAGQASALKMTYAAMTKGFALLGIGALLTAREMDVLEPLTEELALSQSARLAMLENWIPSVGPKAHRWEGEMREIADTFEQAGQSGLFHRGAAEICAQVAATTLGQESPEDRPDRDLATTIEMLGEGRVVNG